MARNKCSPLRVDLDSEEDDDADHEEYPSPPPFCKLLDLYIQLFIDDVI